MMVDGDLVDPDEFFLQGFEVLVVQLELQPEGAI